MLRIEHYGSEAFARDRFRDVSRTKHAPRAINCLARAQVPGKSEGRLGHESLLIVVAGQSTVQTGKEKQIYGAEPRPDGAIRRAVGASVNDQGCVNRFF
ncbi:MAG TPA: hypothetical protein VGJ76_10050 [Pseudolabrys sp.]|jgi:hypothetical protein